MSTPMTPRERAEKLMFERDFAVSPVSLTEAVTAAITEALAAQREADARILEAPIMLAIVVNETKREYGARLARAYAAAIRRTSEEKQDG
jgi:hypothetical protein